MNIYTLPYQFLYVSLLKIVELDEGDDSFLALMNTSFFGCLLSPNPTFNHLEGVELTRLLNLILESYEKDALPQIMKSQPMSEAYEVVRRIQEGDSNFQSSYTEVATHAFSIMSVNDKALFKDLSLQEKLLLSSRKDSKFPILNIWTNSYIFIPFISQWFIMYSLNTWNNALSYAPSFIHLSDELLLDLEQMDVFYRVPY